MSPAGSSAASQVVAGIDEAGYGPPLGPLVVACAAYRLGAGTKESVLHRLLSLPARAGGLPVDDSKRLYAGARGLARLETTALGHIALLRGALPLRVGSLLEHAVDLHPESLAELPWYTKLSSLRLPQAAAVDDILTRSARQQELLDDRSLSLAGLWVAPVLEPRFNELTRQRSSKAWPLFLATGRLLDTLMAACPRDEILVHIDRHGGRAHYAELLTGFFPLAPLRILREEPEESAYRLSFPGRPPVELRFTVRADGQRAPTALASVLAKTVRELFMCSLNAWFAERVPGVKPTAGYPVDARRFLREVSGVLEIGNQRQRLVRIR
ncbi:MAG: hypothetical protein ACT4PU_00365 [Planctomycetota bacterium]